MLKGPQSIVSPHEANRTELLVTHTERYLNSLNVSEKVLPNALNKEMLVKLPLNSLELYRLSILWC